MGSQTAEASEVDALVRRISSAGHSETATVLAELERLVPHLSAADKKAIGRIVTGQSFTSAARAVAAVRAMLRARQSNLAAGERVRRSTASG